MTSHLPRLWALGLRFGIYFGFAWGAVTWRRWQKRRKEAIARTWPSVEGLILTGHVTPAPKTSCFLATLQYTYFVDEYHTGAYIHEFAKESDADDFVRQLTNQRVPIRYNPSQLDRSVLVQAVAEQHASSPRYRVADPVVG
ncbi:MAG: DUF3592 domain-containing protein [Acidobacteriota bacterium]|nr:DUF3592 domain-containing protein [Acidobacteriota bacterium]